MLSKIPTLASLLIFAGCASTFPKPASITQGANAEYALPPKQLLQTVKQVVAAPPMNLGVEQESKGTLITGWKEYPGDWHVARRWQERTRFRINIIPDFDDPTGHARIEVSEETQQRATDGQNWESADAPPRPERSRELLKQIDQKISGKT